MFIPDCTLVTACFSLTKYNPAARPMEQTVNNCRVLLSIPCYLVIYCNREVYETIKQVREDEYKLGHCTKWIVQELEDIWAYQYFDKVNENRKVYWPTRDPRAGTESHIINCNKCDFVLQILHSNPFNTSRFGWIDSNLGDNGTKITEQFNQTEFMRVLSNVPEQYHIQVMGVVDKKFKQKENKREFYQQYRWIACGSMFTMGKRIGEKVMKRLKELVSEATDLGVGHGDELLHLEILDEFYDDIHRGYGDYRQIVHNYIEPTRNISYIQNNIIQRYLDFGYNREAYDCCKRLLKPIEEFRVSISPGDLLSLYFRYYLAAFYHKKYKAKRIVEKVYRLCAENPDIAAEFEKRKDFYESQFKYVL